MLKIAICDDEADTRFYLSSLIRSQACPCEITEYASAGDCLADIREIDLYFLDISLNPKDHGPDGITIARALRERNIHIQPVIIFITGYEQYVFDAFDVNAFQYLLKPVDEQRFAEVFARAAAQIEADREPAQEVRALTFHSANTARTVLPDQIYYIESSNHKVILHLKTGEFTYYARISDLERELQGQFFRVHKGYLVNLSYIESYSRTEIILTNKDKVLISKYKYRDFVKSYLLFLKKESRL